MLSLFDLNRTAAKNYLLNLPNLWEFAVGLSAFLLEFGAGLNGDYRQICGGVWVHTGAKIAPSARVEPPAVICKGASLRHCAYVRGNALIGRGCVVGNCSEIKNSILFDGAKVPHFNYVGDSILGYSAHFGAGVKTANLKSDGGEITITTPNGRANTRLKKLGAFVGDYCEVGCNSVLAPAAVLGKHSRVYPLCFARGYLPPDCILKGGGIVTKIT